LLFLENTVYSFSLMSVRMKMTRSKTGNRRSHHRASVPTATKTENGVRRRHFADPVTGMYRGKQACSPEHAPVSHKKDTPATAEKKEAKKAVKEIKKEKTA
jgi:ribosomal protein L32